MLHVYMIIYIQYHLIKKEAILCLIGYAYLNVIIDYKDSLLIYITKWLVNMVIYSSGLIKKISPFFIWFLLIIYYSIYTYVF